MKLGTAQKRWLLLVILLSVFHPCFIRGYTLLRPGWRRCRKVSPFARERVSELDLPRVQAERWRVDAQRLRVAHRVTGQINRISADRETQMPQVHANLIRASGERPRFQQCRAIRPPFPHSKF